MRDPRLKRLAAALGGLARADLFRAPGRVNLMGDHTDYNRGFVLPAAIDRDCVIASRPTGDGFGGCVVSLVARERAAKIAEGAAERYRAEIGLEPQAILCRATAGAGPL